MEDNWLLSRTVELAATYLVQSTLLLLPVSTLMWIRSNQRFKPNPMMAERLWKLAAVLPLMTAPICVCSGWSRPIWEWSVHGIRPSSRVSAVKTAEGVEVAEVPQTVTVVPELAPDVSSVPLELDKTISPFVESEDRSQDLLLAETEMPYETDVGTHSTKVTELARGLPTVNPIDGTRQSCDWIAVLGIAILSWMGGSILRLAVLTGSLQQRLAACSVESGVLNHELKRLSPSSCSIRLLRSGLKTKSSAVFMSEPCACGMWNWTIVLPVGFEQQLSGEEIRALLAHEIAHLVRRDPWWMWVWEALCSCLAFQPLNVTARRGWQQAAELLCDDWAVRRQVSAMALASCLTRIAEWRMNQRRAATMGLAAVGRSGSLTRRIEWLLRSDRNDKEGYFSASLLMTVLAFSVGLAVGSYGPRLTLISTAEAGSDESAVLWIEIAHELELTLDELRHLQSSLSNDPEITDLIDRLRVRANLLRDQLK